ncbi:GvpL/GvpF family gas vesicle protein [Actinacidiphila paucisporea]|uniref:Gas vesicle synthesis protein GvpL/GvpF n=1 Tax=Actinacidiphila paucisporea TaxID=310782 RepID=A0A1M7M050_9ACTN|nr:GvpL/GvpF family gas vesicle protein [Actinacidiphila paucisporea]SHM83497.1 Gas vesicle synthesis protein GvpL/GvpF [Actinacidiphila paucisporea]
MTATDEAPVAAPGAMATCVFAVRRGGPSGGLTGVRGHAAGGHVGLLPLPGGLWAVAQDVPAELFSQEALRARLSDPEQLEDCARAHHAVVTAAAADGPVVPLALATLFTDAERARATLDEQQPRFLAALDRLTGRTEWAVKVHVRHRGGNGTEGPAAPGPAASTSGRAYLSRVRGREKDRRARQDAALDAARQVHEAAAGFAVASVRRRPHGTEITGRGRVQVLNAAYLVDDARADRLVAAVRAMTGAFAGVDAHAEVSGPWVPYSFAEVADAGSVADGGIG